MLEPKTGTTPHYKINQLATLPPVESPYLVVYIETPYPHIRILWGLEYVMTSCMHPTPKDCKVPTFSMAVKQGHLHTTIEVNLNCLQVSAKYFLHLE